MTTDDKRKVWETYVSAWKAATAEAKAAALAASVDAACVYRDPLIQTAGHAALIEYMLGFHQQVPGGQFRTKYFLAHHDRSIARWDMLSGDGAVVSEGISYGEYSAQGRLVAMTGFFEVPPR